MGTKQTLASINYQSMVLHLSIQGTMKNMPGPLAPPFLRRPSRKITALSYSFTTWSRWLVFLSWNSWRSFRRANIPTFTFTLTQKIKLRGSVARQQSTCGRKQLMNINIIETGCFFNRSTLKSTEKFSLHYHALVLSNFFWANQLKRETLFS